MIFTKRCAKCGKSFMRMGCAPGQCGLLGRMLGGLTCFLLFGGTSKFCPDCRDVIKQQQEESDTPQKSELDKGALFRIIWFAAACLVIYLIIFALNK